MLPLATRLVLAALLVLTLTAAGGAMEEGAAARAPALTVRSGSVTASR